MRNTSPARVRFRALIRLPEERIDLAEAALCIAWEDQGGPLPEFVLHDLDAIASALRPQLAGLARPQEVVAVLNRYLFGELGFRGNTWHRDDPANSFLDRVLVNRTGLPILLSLIYIEVGRRLALPIVGLALPGHFLARYMAPDEDIFVDPFHAGRIWSYDECQAQVAKFFGSATPMLMRRCMAPPSRRAILARILRNLKNTYIGMEDFARALAAVERIIMLEPGDIQEVRDRGLLRVRAGQFVAALEDLERYARAAPQAPDVPDIRRQARLLVEHLIEIN